MSSWLEDAIHVEEGERPVPRPVLVEFERMAPWMQKPRETKEKGQETPRVKCAVVRFKDRLFEGSCHGDARLAALRDPGMRGVKWEELEEGFVTNTGEFLTRLQAMILARQQGQLHDDVRETAQQLQSHYLKH